MGLSSFGKRKPLSFKIALALMLIATSKFAIGDPLVTLDANRNHILEESEAQAAGRRLFDTLDTDRDGRLQPNEVAASAGRC